MIEFLLQFPPGMTQVIAWSSLLGLFWLLQSLYSAFLGPLSKYPGPKLWALTQFPRARSQFAGELAFRGLEFHEKYGPVVRIAPNELSYVSETAWADVYGKNDGRKQLAKDPSVVVTPPNGIPGLAFTQSDAAHARMRRNLSNGFSEKAVREQEPILNHYVNLLVERLRAKSGGENLDIAHWYHLFTFDIVGDLTFGDSFHGLEKSVLHPWISNLFFFIQARVKISGIMRILPIGDLIIWLGRKKYADEDKLHLETVHTRLAKRLSMKHENRKDFITSVEKNLNQPNGISVEELQDTATTLIIAGSETTATAMSGITYFLLTHPSAYRTLVEEIRSTFSDESQITMHSVSKLEYERAVIEESLRLFPPLPSQIRRITPPEGVNIDNSYVAGSTIVSISQWSVGRYSKNFTQALNFLPERWLPNQQNAFAADRKKAVQPFSTGPRACMGKALAYSELRLVLAKILWNFDLQLAPESQDWMNQIKIWGIYRKIPLIVRLKPREASK